MISAGIAFEGCGCRAAFHVGVIEWLTERGLVPAAVTGASSGALIAAALAFGRVDRIRPAWLELLGTRVFQGGRLLRGRWPFVMTDIVSSAACSQFEGLAMHDAPVPLGVVVTHVGRRGPWRRLITHREAVPVPKAILASCFIPGPYSTMVPLDRRLTFDGAWLARVPVDDVAELGTARVIACVADDHGRLMSGVLGRSRAAAPRAEYRILSPVAPVPLGIFDFDPEGTRQAFEIGRRSAERFVAGNECWLAG